MNTGLLSGTVTFLFTEFEGSTQQMQRLGESYASVLATERRLLRAAFRKFHGHKVDTQGDSFLVAFGRAANAIGASVAAQRALFEHAWPAGESVRVRMGLHTGAPQLTAAGYVGPDVHIVARLCAAAHGGQIVLSQATRDVIEQQLPDGVRLRDLGEHRLKDLNQPRHLFQLVLSELPNEFPPLRSLDALRHNLPIQLTSFVGRGPELAETKRLLSTTRLLTITGAGGAGKTRLALQVAAELLESYDDGVWLIELAPLTDPALVLQTVAAVLGVPGQPAQPILNSLIDYLRTKNLLMVIDNCEHLIESCARFADAVLHACPYLRLLATSREALVIAGETVWSVPSLSLPDVRQHRPSFADLSQYEAIQLFVDRAVTVQPNFKLTELNASAVAQICQRLDGIPLAIELAAARVKVLQTAEIAARLDDSFNLLTGGSRTALPRQQTLRAAIDWSYDLLTNLERVLLRRLSVFPGGCTLAAAELVCADQDEADGIWSSQILDLLSHLVDKSLVIVDKQGDKTRYRMLETIRQYGYEKLVGAGEAGMVHQRQLEWLVQFAKEADPKLRGPEMKLWAQRLDNELDNIRTTLEWGFEHGQSSNGAELVGALAWYNFLRSNDREAKRWSEKAASLTGDAPSTARAEALLALGVALTDLGEEKAETVLQEALTHYRAFNNQWRAAFVLNTLGVIKYRQDELYLSEEYLQEALTLRRTIGDEWGITHTLQNFGAIAERREDYAKAQAIHEEGLQLSEALGDERMVARRFSDVGRIALAQGDLRRADTMLRRAVSALWRIKEKSSLLQALEPLARVMAAQGQARRAAQLLSAVETAREDLGINLPEAQHAAWGRLVGPIQAQLGEEEFRKARADGHAMTLDQAIAYALETPPPEQKVETETPRQAPKQEFVGLTEREREVATHIAQGESNREIAEALVLSERTVETHISNILNKLGFVRRSQIRKWAVEKGMLKRIE